MEQATRVDRGKKFKFTKGAWFEDGMIQCGSVVVLILSKELATQGRNTLQENALR